jgi:hypothetical protein
VTATVIMRYFERISPNANIDSRGGRWRQVVVGCVKPAQTHRCTPGRSPRFGVGAKGRRSRVEGLGSKWDVRVPQG